MSFFISDAWAEAAPAAGQDAGLMGFLPLIIIFVIFYFLLMRPQMKRAKEHRKMVEALGKNDEVVTSGGIMGKVTTSRKASLPWRSPKACASRYKKARCLPFCPRVP